MTYLYRVFDEYGVLLYVGVTDNPTSRFHQHRSDKSWWWQSHRLELSQFANRGEALRAEADAITHEGPVFNLAGRSPAMSDLFRQSHQFCGVLWQATVGGGYDPAWGVRDATTALETADAEGDAQDLALTVGLAVELFAQRMARLNMIEAVKAELPEVI